MNKFTKAISSLLLAATLILGFGVPSVTHAYAGDPIVTVVTTPTIAVAGQPVTFTLTIDQAGYAPTNGTQKITWFNPRTFATVNVANYLVIPETYADGVWTFTYVPGYGEVGRVETFSVKVPVSAARIPRTVLGQVSFNVVAPPVVAP